MNEMNGVPNEILDYILDYIPLRERIQKRLVCKRFRDVTPSWTFDFDESDTLKKLFIEQATIINIPYLCDDKDSLIMLKFKIFDTINLKYRHEINIGFHNTFHIRPQTIINRYILVDDNLVFSHLDDLDDHLYFEGVKKLICSVRNILTLSSEKGYSLRIDNELFDWTFRTLEYYFQNSKENTIPEFFKSLVTSEHVEYVEKLLNTNLENINHILSTRLEKINPLRRRKYIELLFSILFKE